MLACINALRMSQKLTPQQEKFADLVARGAKQADAYREAFPKSLNWKPATIWSKASTLAADGKVQARIEEIREEIRDLGLWTREESVLALRAVADQRGVLAKGGEIVAAVRELNAMHGYNAPQKHEHTGGDGKPLLEELVKAVLGTTLPIRHD